MIVDAEEKKEYARMLSNILLNQEKCVLQEKKVDLIHREYDGRQCTLDLINKGREN